MPEYNCRNRSTRESGLATGWCTRAVEVGGITTASGRMTTGGITKVTLSVAVAESFNDLAAGAGTATVTRAGEATGGVCRSSAKSAVGTSECATPDESMRRGSAVGMGEGASKSTELGGEVFGCTCRASAAAFCLFARSALRVAASAALFRTSGVVEVSEAVGGTAGAAAGITRGAAAGITRGATGSRDRVALQVTKQISKRVRARLTQV